MCHRIDPKNHLSQWFGFVIIPNLHRLQKVLYEPSVTVVPNISACHKQLKIIIIIVSWPRGSHGISTRISAFDMEPTIPDFGIPPSPHALEMPENSAFYSPEQSRAAGQSWVISETCPSLQQSFYIHLTIVKEKKNTGTLDGTLEGSRRVDNSSAN